MKIWKQKSILVGIVLLLGFGIAAAQAPVEELRTDISDKQQELEKLAAEIAEHQKEINRRQRIASSLKNEIALFDLQIRQTEAQIRTKVLEIQELSTDILETQEAIQEKNEQLEKQKDFLGETLRLINEYDSVTPLEITFDNDTFSEYLDQAQYAVNLQEKNQEILNQVKTLKAELEAKKAQLEAELAKHEDVKHQLDIAQASLSEQRNSKQSLLTATRGQEKIYQNLLEQAAKKQEEVEREIFELEVAIRQQLGDKTLPPVSGLLRWPMSGILTQSYGKTGFTALGYNFHNGLDIAAPAGTTIYAAADGLVFATGTGQAAYGNWVVMKHTLSQEGKIFNIYTLYAHMQRFIVSEGQAVRGGDVVGYEGNTGNTTRLLYGPERGYHVHFTIFDEEGFSIKQGAFQHLYGPYQIPYGYTYNPMNFLK